MAIRKIVSRSIADSTISVADINATGTKDSTTFLRGDGSFAVVAVTPTAVSSQSNSATDYFDLPAGTTAERPVSANSGMLRYNTDLETLEQYTTTSGWVPMVSPPTIVSIDPSAIPATDTSFDITITGTNFTESVIVTAIGQDSSVVTATTVVRNSSTQLTATFDGSSFVNAQEDYTIRVLNSSGLDSTLSNALSVNATPVWSTASGSLGSFNEYASVSTSVSATDPEGTSITYSLSSGSLPTGLSLNTSTGAITGTSSEVSGDTTSSFNISASDGTNSNSRSFSITVLNTYAYSTTNLSWDLRARDQSFSVGSISNGTALSLSTVSSAGTSAQVRHGTGYFETGASGPPSGKAFYFNANGALSVNTSSSSFADTYYNNAASQSTVAWFRWSSDSSRQVLIARYEDTTPVRQWNAIIDPGREFHYNSSGVIPGASGDINVTSFNLNTWHLHHKVYNVADGTFRWYIDGAQVAITTPGTDGGNGLTGYSGINQYWTIGARTDDAERLNNCYVAEARHYHRALTAAEILAEWNASKASFGR